MNDSNQIFMSSEITSSSQNLSNGEEPDNSPDGKDGLGSFQRSSITDHSILSNSIIGDTTMHHENIETQQGKDDVMDASVNDVEEGISSSLLNDSNNGDGNGRNNQSLSGFRYHSKMSFCIIFFLSLLLISSIVGIAMFAPSKSSRPLLIEKITSEPSLLPTLSPVADPFSKKLWIELATVESLDDGDEAGGSSSMSYDGQRIIIGARKYLSHTGIVRIFDLEEAQSGSYDWKKSAALQGTNEGDLFGDAVSLSGDGNR